MSFLPFHFLFSQGVNTVVNLDNRLHFGLGDVGYSRRLLHLILRSELCGLYKRGTKRAFGLYPHTAGQHMYVIDFQHGFVSLVS